jgi:hypothetical protein
VLGEDYEKKVAITTLGLLTAGGLAGCGPMGTSYYANTASDDGFENIKSTKHHDNGDFYSQTTFNNDGTYYRYEHGRSFDYSTTPKRVDTLFYEYEIGTWKKKGNKITTTLSWNGLIDKHVQIKSKDGKSHYKYQSSKSGTSTIYRFNKNKQLVGRTYKDPQSGATTSETKAEKIQPEKAGLKGLKSKFKKQINILHAEK